MNDSSEQVTAIDGNVEVQRTIEDRPTATVVVYRLKTLASEPSVVQLEETIPPQDSIETLEFHPDHLPNQWTKGDGIVQFAATVSPDETRMIVLGLDAADETPLRRDGPTISLLEMGVDDIRECNDSAPLPDSDNTETPDEGCSGDPGHDLEAVADGGDTTPDAASDDVLDLPDPNEDDGETPDDVLDLPDPNADMAATAVDEATQSTDLDSDMEAHSAETGARRSSDDQADTADSDDVAAIDNAAEELGLDDDTAEDRRLGDDAAVDLGLDDESDGGSTAKADGESVVGDLLADIRAGHASEGQLDALRSELGVARADEVRLRHVQSRMNDFEAYVDGLEEIINSHGTASEFVDGIERTVTDLEDELSAIRGAVSTVENGLETADEEREQLTEEVADLDETVAELTAEVATLQDSVETVDERTNTLETELRAEIEALRDERTDQFDRIESELEATREQLEADFESEFDSLREDVESFNELRRTLLDAFGNGIDVTPDADTAER